MSAAVIAQPQFDRTNLIPDEPPLLRYVTKGIRDFVAKHLVERNVYECAIELFVSRPRRSFPTKHEFLLNHR